MPHPSELEGLGLEVERSPRSRGPSSPVPAPIAAAAFGGRGGSVSVRHPLSKTVKGRGRDGGHASSRAGRALKLASLALALAATVLVRFGWERAEAGVDVPLPAEAVGHTVKEKVAMEGPPSVGNDFIGGAVPNATSAPGESIEVAKEGDSEGVTEPDAPRLEKNDRSTTNAPGDGDPTIGSSIRTDARGLYWTESHSPRGQSNATRDVRISFRLHSPDDVPHPRQYLSVHGYACSTGTLPPSLAGRTVLNFTTTVSTDLNILFVGDSISQQFAQGFYSSVLGDDHVGGHAIVRSFVNGVPIIAKGKMFTNSGLHVCSSLVAPARGGGVSAYWRVLALMSNTTERKGYVNCKNEIFWNAAEAKLLSDHRYIYPPGATKKGMEKVETARNGKATTWVRSEQRNATAGEASIHRVGDFDACVLRPQHGWMKLGEITRERIVEEIRLCGEAAGARTAVVTTLPLNNNVLTLGDWDGIIRINEVIRDIARSWNVSSADNGITWVLVQEFGNLTNQILWRNAEHIGYNISTPDFSQSNGWERQGSEFLLHRYRGIKGMRHAPSIPMVCAYHIEQPFSTKNESAGACFFNKISRDGMHWCVESIGPRYAASVACLLGCVYNGAGPGAGGDAGLRQCERECNDRFMTLIPVDEGWVGTNATMFARYPGSSKG